MGTWRAVFFNAFLLLGPWHLKQGVRSDEPCGDVNVPLDPSLDPSGPLTNSPPQLTEATNPPYECVGDPNQRRDCGYPGISASECAKRNCCYDSSIPGVNWCFFSKSQNSAQCAASPTERTDCGYPGISPKECYSRGCCFNSSIPGVKWCFYPKNNATNPTNECVGDPNQRRDCGYPGISASECAKRNCCYDSSIPGVNWCFFSKSQNSAQCAVSPTERTDCGYPGISPKECYSRGCCFNSSVRGVKWCFFPKGTPNTQYECFGNPYLRRDCGYPGISPSECAKRSCCYDSSIPGVNWCFHTRSQDQAQCTMNAKERTDCGYPGISSTECHSRRCCFDSSVPGVNWCFYPKSFGCSVHPKLRKDCGGSQISALRTAMPKAAAMIPASRVPSGVSMVTNNRIT
ncbi:integumentary mucin C.1-like isoform X2 [Spea bombifrons]|uniref:integumentary mucin C.1-like isoform X2 n=1 Tax=Spea bombifrons TaxID=233779 RepID=UPI002349CF2D|nr:integumentary mucin C.1-like isoform X2 [Spea bombifrons]